MQQRAAAIFMAVSIVAMTSAACLAHREISPKAVTSPFVSQVRDFLDKLDVGVEDFAVRINRCVGRAGEISEDRFYVWAGFNGTSPTGEASRILSAVLIAKIADGWLVTRDRHMDNGGRNIALTNPQNGWSYALDSGFDIGPDTHIVGFFSTRCYWANGPVSFGRAEGPWS